MTIEISASILSANFARLGDQVQDAISAGADRIHVDVMDGHFVPNLTIGPLVVESISPYCQAGNIPLEAHLMVENPDIMIDQFAKAGVNVLYVHVETCPHLHRTIQHIKQLGLQAGVTLNPATPLSTLDEIILYVDVVLIMSVNPGFGGQTYIPASTSRIKRLRQTLNNRNLGKIDISVDGGINTLTAPEIAAAGATIFIVGSAVFNEFDIKQNIKAIRQAAES